MLTWVIVYLSIGFVWGVIFNIRAINTINAEFDELAREAIDPEFKRMVLEMPRISWGRTIIDVVFSTLFWPIRLLLIMLTRSD